MTTRMSLLLAALLVGLTGCSTTSDTDRPGPADEGPAQSAPASGAERPRVTAADYEAAVHAMTACLNESGIGLINDGWDPVDNERMLLRFTAPGMGAEQVYEITGRCESAHLADAAARRTTIHYSVLTGGFRVVNTEHARWRAGWTRDEAGVMGVLHDYFRAPDRVAVLRAMQGCDGGPLIVPGPFDGVALKGLDEAVILGQLIALIQGVEWAPDITGSTVIHPPPETMPATPEEWQNISPESPWVEGPWVTELSSQTRDTLAAVDDSQIPVIAASWATIEEFHGDVDTDTAAEVIAELRALARRAVESGDHIYCWTSL